MKNRNFKCALHRTKLSLFILLPFIALNVWAFPSWIGVYGSFQRHMDGNPGTYTVLMNQDYYGLEAEVGIQVGAGSWSTYSMNYVGNVSGNSKWTFRPDAAYPTNTTITFYFRGFDSGSNNIYDNNGGANYTFTAGATGTISWVGNTSQWPADGSVESTNDFWVNVDVWPAGAATEGYAVYAPGGGIWYSSPLQYLDKAGNDDRWHANLGTFPPGAALYYFLGIEDGTGTLLEAPTGSTLYATSVNGSSTDGDSDNLPDDWENYWWGNTNQLRIANPDDDGYAGWPLDNFHEYVTGSNPTVSNNSQNIATLWFPSDPVQGGWIRLSYFSDTGTPLDGETNIYAYVGFNDWLSSANRGPMTYNASLDRFSVSFQVPTNAVEINVAYTDGASLWDNNLTLDWVIPVRPPETGEDLDSDRDGLSDAWEGLYGLDPLDDGSFDVDQGASGDPDGDTMSNFQEFQAGTNPTVYNPAPNIMITYPKGVALP